ncbi:MAG: hypothetical protein WBE26_11195, partial [Phycisphaerae bacterium]
YEGLEELYQELVTLGFESVALALRARQAAHQQDDLGELRALHALVASLPHEEKTRSSWLHRYAQVLESLWCLEEARTAQREAGIENQAVSCWLDEAAKVIGGDNWIAEPGISLPALIAAATIIGKPFRGKWVIATSTQLKYDGGTLTPQTLAAKYEEVKARNKAPETPPVRTERVWWIRRDSVREIGIVLLGDPTDQASPAISPAVQVREDAQQVVSAPVVLLEAGRPADNVPVEAHNQRVLSAVEAVSHLGPDGLWPPRARQVMMSALRALLTEAKWRSLW